MSGGRVPAGKFITFEGGEGAGKSTQIARLANRLEKKGIAAITTREPGGTDAAEAVRRLLVTGEAARWDGVSEALLLFAARRSHAEELIKPALEEGKWVLCDRFADSTTAYQGIVRGIGEDAVKTLYKLTLGDFAPDLTLILDINPAAGLKRSHARNHAEATGETRFEEMGKDFHDKLRQAYRKIAQDNSGRCELIDASGPEGAVAEKVWQIVARRFKL